MQCFCENLDSTATGSSKGEPSREPKNYAYGMRDFDINDLDGNQLCFGMEWKQPQTTP